MPLYRIELTPEAVEQLAALPAKDQQRVVDKLRALEREPEGKGTRRLKGTTDGRRLSVGPYRVLYRVMKVRVLVLVVKVDGRKDVYRRIQRLFELQPPT